MDEHLQTGARKRQAMSSRGQVMLATLLLGIFAAVTATILFVSMPPSTAVTVNGADPTTAIQPQEAGYPAGFEQVARLKARKSSHTRPASSRYARLKARKSSHTRPASSRYASLKARKSSHTRPASSSIDFRRNRPRRRRKFR